MAGLGSTILPCCLYFVYAIAYMVFSVLTQLHISADIYQAVVKPFQETPWMHVPPKYINDVSGGDEVYEWIQNVFLNKVYGETNEIGDPYYCSEVFPCLLNEGPSRKNSTCAKYLKTGENNCPMFMGSADSCCKPCEGIDCPNTTLQLAGCSLEANTSTSDVADSCADEMPSWMPFLTNWPQDTGFTFPDMASSCPTDNTNSDYKFCPERLDKVPSENIAPPVAPRFLTMATFNQVVYGRMTLKRMKMVPDTAAAFTNAYPLHPEGGEINPAAQTDNDNRSSFGDTVTYHYDEKGGFRRSGGFVHYLDFNKSQREIRNEIATLKDNYWFDLRQGSFVLELLVFNGNYETFLYVQFIFQHMYNGLTSVAVEVYPLNMSILNPDLPVEFYIRYIMLGIMVLGLIFFLKSELDDMSAEPGVYISNPVNILHIASMSLSFVGLVFWFITVYSYAYGVTSLPFPEAEVGKLDAFNALVDLCENVNIFIVVSSINICLIIMRSISLLATMTPYSNVIFATIYHARHDMASFMTVFLTLFMGFTFAGFYLCGTRVQSFNSLSQAYISCLQMVMSYSNYNNIVRGDPIVGIGYFYGFHLFFIITQNLLLSIICGAYNEERKSLDDEGVANKFPLRRFAKAAKIASRDLSRIITRLTSGVVQFLFGTASGSAIRVNVESLYRLTDKRAGSRPIKRTVQYDQKNDDEYDRRYPDKDMKLVGKPALYRNGLMNYYVEEAFSGGLAEENGVGPDFRLVCIKMQGNEDRKNFREPEVFNRVPEDPDDNGYAGDPQEMLRLLKNYLPVTLEFEGKIKIFTIGCLWTVFFVLTTCLFFNFATRVNDSYFMFAIQSNLLESTHWYSHNPKQRQNWSTLQSIDDYGDFVYHTVPGAQYICVTTIDDPATCALTASSLTKKVSTEYTRPNYVLWAGPNGPESPEFPLEALGFTPSAVQGLSLGWIPWSGEVGGNPSWSANLQTVPREVDFNVGFMQNNFMRATIQVACFRENKRAQFAGGFPYVLSNRVGPDGCAHSTCMKQMIQDYTEDGKPCLASDGSPRDPRTFKGLVTGANYDYREDGSYDTLGGIVVGFGGTPKEAMDVVRAIGLDSLTSNPAVNSIVLEYAIYNANLDLFSYTTVAISVAPTGKVNKQIRMTSFPLKLLSMGGGKSSEGQRVLCFVLLALFVFCVLGSIVSFLYDLSIQYRINHEMQKPLLYFIPSFFSESWWNFLDFGTIIVNVFTIYSLLQFIFIGSSGEGDFFETWTTTKYKFSRTVSEDTQDAFQNFALAAFYYRCFTTGGGFSTLLICIRSVKYFVVIQQMQLVISTIVYSFWELYYMLLILCLSLMAFSFMFHTRFAITLNVFSTIDRAFCELYLYMVGIFDTTTVYQASPTYFVLTFTAVQFVFYFLLSNMFLATLVFKWKDNRRNAQDDVKSTFERIYSSMTCCKSEKGTAKGEDNKKKALDKSFWKECSVLNYLDRFDEYGKIRDSVPTGKPNDEGATNGHGQKYNLEEVFTRAHMEIASKMCRTTVARPVDFGGGVGEVRDRDAEDEGAGEDDSGDYVGIIELEDQVEEATAVKIKTDLEEKFKQEDSHAWEIWLDALTTVLEDHGFLDKLQQFFLPQPMLKPRSSQEWGHFDQRKVKMEKRLDLFLGLMMEETYIAHYRYLRESAKTKQKVLKQQSLVLADYLDQLDFRIRELNEEIKVLDRRNGEMRSHVQPLL